MSEKPQHMSALIILYCAAFVSAFNENIINVGLVDIMSNMSVDSITAQWLVTGYMIVCAIVIMLTAFMTQKFSTRKLFLFASVVLVLGEVLSFFAPNFAILLIGRLIQAVGSGIFIPLMMNAVLILVPRKKIGTYLAIGSACITLGPAFAPVLSGMMVTLFGWRTIFVIPAVVTVIMALMSIKFMVNMSEVKPVKLDALSLILSALGLTALVYGFSQLMVNMAYGLIALAIAIVLLGWFIKRQFGLKTPMLNMEPMTKSWFSVALIMLVVSMMISFSMSVLLPMYFENVFEMTALFAGLMLLAPIFGNAIAAVISGRIMDKFGEWPLIPAGFLCILVGQFGIALIAPSINTVAVVLCAVVVYCGVGFCMSPVQTAGLKCLNHELHAHGISIINTIIMVSAAIGPSLFIGTQAAGVAEAAAAGSTVIVANAMGFSQAIWLATGVALIGLAVAIPYSLKAHKRDKDAREVLEENEK